ncbi:MAG: hypothetical protein N2320_06060, partial [Candidatus Bipolaricaulota bacterium]|nr:hypothetical protein [Candidatus Bipolaricaulota bacterium]
MGLRWGSLVVAVLVAGSVEGRAAKAFGGLTAQATLTPTSVAVGTRFDWSYFSGAVADLPRSTLSAIPSLAENTEKSTGLGYQIVLPSPAAGSYVQFFGYLKQDIVMDWPVGVVGAVTELSFSWDLRRHYLWSYAWVHYGGAALRIKLSLARVDALAGSGMEVGVEGTTLRGLTLTVSSQFGLTADRVALLRAVSLGQVAGEMFEYRGTTLTVGTFSLCCLSFEAMVKLTKTGFDSVQLWTAYTFELAEGDVTVSVNVVFQTADKSLSILPRLVLSETGSEIYLSYS